MITVFEKSLCSLRCHEACVPKVFSVIACTSAYCQEVKTAAEVAETSALKIAKVLGDNALPAVRWVEAERLRACCYGGTIDSMPKLDLRPPAQEAKQYPPQKITLQGENFLRVYVPRGGQLKFRVTARAADSLFADSTYAVFDPDGKHIADGIVKPGESQNVAIPVENEGLYLVLSKLMQSRPRHVALSYAFGFHLSEGKSKEA